MKQNYEAAELELLSLDLRDVITDSPNSGIIDDSNEDFQGGDIIIIA